MKEMGLSEACNVLAPLPVDPSAAALNAPERNPITVVVRWTTPLLMSLDHGLQFGRVEHIGMVAPVRVIICT